MRRIPHVWVFPETGKTFFRPKRELFWTDIEAYIHGDDERMDKETPPMVIATPWRWPKKPRKNDRVG